MKVEKNSGVLLLSSSNSVLEIDHLPNSTFNEEIIIVFVFGFWFSSYPTLMHLS